MSLNNIVSNNLSFFPFLLCLNASKIVAQGTRQRGCLLFVQIAKKFQVYFIHIISFKKPKKIDNRANELYCDATIFVVRFFIVYLSKKMETEKWPNAADSPLFKKNPWKLW